MLRRLALVAMLLGSSLVTTTPAFARAQMDSPYSYRQSFGTALRLIKVDLALVVTEVNAEWGYVLFEYVSADSGARKNRGSLQLVESDTTGSVQVGIQIAQMPSFHEELLLDKLRQKLTDEHGAPPERVRKKESDEDRRGRNPDNVVILEPERDTLKKRR
ncbi:MAG: hypothetical protein FJ096_12535 [Deltaproteobacteria bacterium]|nr:hypothetical protein [Deltaproteobacteria bacterium]